MKKQKEIEKKGFEYYLNHMNNDRVPLQLRYLMSIENTVKDPMQSLTSKPKKGTFCLMTVI